MAASMKPAELPPFLFNAWRFGQHYERVAQMNQELEGWTVSKLVERCLKFVMNAHKTLQETRARQKSTPASLFSIMAGKILEELNQSDNLEADIGALLGKLNHLTLRRLFRDPRATYRVFHTFHLLHLIIPPEKGSGHTPRPPIDIDEAILRNERYVRSRSDVENQDGKYLVRLKDFCVAVGANPDRPRRRSFTRTRPPKGGLETLDECRLWAMSIPSNDEVFVQDFDRATGGILRGLDWSNVLVAGEKVLGIFLPTDDVSGSDIDLYIYGLDAEQANQKVRHIHQVWSNNLPESNHEKLVVKNSRTINLLPSYPNCRVQIILKLVSSPTQVLHNFNLDVCAVGFDGSRVLMLPRCARAIETGYSVFTMDLIWGHRLSERRETQYSRVFKYADRGFGLRILPAYAESLEEDDLERQIRMDPELSIDKEYKEAGLWESRDRKPNGSQEPGLKTLKRVAYLGQNYVQRYCSGATPLTIFPKYSSRSGQQDRGDPIDARPDQCSQWIGGIWDDEDTWKEVFAHVEAENNEAKKRKTEVPGESHHPTTDIFHIDFKVMRQGLLSSGTGLPSFELFIRYCEAWRLDVIGQARFQGQNVIDGPSYDEDNYDEDNYDNLPIYSLDDGLSLKDFGRRVEMCNNQLFEVLKDVIRVRLPGVHHNAPLVGFRDYLTRRIRRQVHGPDIESVLEKQITIPLMIPWDLENYILTQMQHDFPDLATYMTEHTMLIPVHDTSKSHPSRAILPSLLDEVSEKGNLRYWVISNTSMWAGQHRALDEIAEILWSLFHWFNRMGSIYGKGWTAEIQNSFLGTQSKKCLWYMARSFRRRMLLPR